MASKQDCSSRTLPLPLEFRGHNPESGRQRADGHVLRLECFVARGREKNLHTQAAQGGVEQLDPGVVQSKIFCPDVGQVLAVTIQGGADREELVSITHQ